MVWWKAKTPNYVMDKQFVHSLGKGDEITIPAGSFIQPLEFRYVPSHIKEEYSWVDKNHEQFCFTKWGIIPIPKRLLRII